MRLTATQAARDFSRLLDRVENGAEAIIERHSRPVAVIRPPDVVPRRISECMAIKLTRPSVAPDPDFAKDLKEIIEGHRTEEPPSWD